MVQNSVSLIPKSRQFDQYILSDIVPCQTSFGPRNLFYYFLCVEFYCGHFKPITDESLSKIKFLARF
jgi:hypothetical protein